MNGAGLRRLLATTAMRRVSRSARSPGGWDAPRPPSRRTCMTQPATRHARSRRATGECVAAAGGPPRHGTARATRTRIANAAIPARSRRNGHGNGFAKRCAHGERATALRRPPTTGPARTHAGAAAKRSNDYRPDSGPRRPPSSICTGAGRRPAPTPSAAPERSGVNAAGTRTRACAWPSVNGSAEGRRERFCHSSLSRRTTRSRRASATPAQAALALAGLETAGRLLLSRYPGSACAGGSPVSSPSRCAPSIVVRLAVGDERVSRGVPVETRSRPHTNT